MDVLVLGFFFSLSSYVQSKQANVATAPTHLIVTRVGPCYEYPVTRVSVSEMKLKKQEYDFSLSGSINISENIDNGWSIRATMQKCNDIRNLDTCDYYKSFSVIKSGCGKRVTDDDDENYSDEEEITEPSKEAEGEIDNDEDIYTMFFHYVTPKMECPILAGRYRVEDYPFFTEDSDLTAAESKISTSVFGYTFRLEAFGIDDEDKIMCIEAHIQMTFVRVHDWTDGRARQGAPVTSAPDKDSDTGGEDEDVEE